MQIIGSVLPVILIAALPAYFAIWLLGSIGPIR
jgi:hypothetical protein